MSGITRIKIQSNWKDWRTDMADELAPAADTIYREAFGSIGMPISEGVDYVNVTKDEAMARYDWKEGIDVILQFTAGSKATLQEKYLTYWESTATFEERKTSGAPGAWYYCTAQYYFVGYAWKYWDYKSREVYPHAIKEFQDGILLDLAATHRSDSAGEIDWLFNGNQHDGRRASFRYVNFNNIPSSCIIARYPWQLSTG